MQVSKLSLMCKLAGADHVMAVVEEVVSGEQVGENMYTATVSKQLFMLSHVGEPPVSVASRLTLRLNAITTCVVVHVAVLIGACGPSSTRFGWVRAHVQTARQRLHAHCSASTC